MIACTSTWLPGTVTRTCSARVQRCRTFQSAAMNWDGSVSGSYQGMTVDKRTDHEQCQGTCPSDAGRQRALIASHSADGVIGSRLSSFLYNSLEQIPRCSVLWWGWQQAGKTRG